MEVLPDITFGLWQDDLSLAYMNPAWFAFAQRNGGGAMIQWPLGRSVLEAMPAPLSSWYRNFLRKAAATADELHPSQHTYRCSSASVHREFAMLVYPLPATPRAGFVIRHCLAVERSHCSPNTPAPVAEEYTDRTDMISQCMHCRQVRSATTPGVWRWVAEWVSNPPPNVTHVLCEVCLGHYYALPAAPLREHHTRNT